MWVSAQSVQKSNNVSPLPEQVRKSNWCCRDYSEANIPSCISGRGYEIGWTVWHIWTFGTGDDIKTMCLPPRNSPRRERHGRAHQRPRILNSFVLRVNVPEIQNQVCLIELRYCVCTFIWFYIKLLFSRLFFNFCRVRTSKGCFPTYRDCSYRIPPAYGL